MEMTPANFYNDNSRKNVMVDDLRNPPKNFYEGINVALISLCLLNFNSILKKLWPVQERKNDMRMKKTMLGMPNLNLWC
jgi:hypothetical protein